MAPIYVKGGVWTNVEDQILKAAVSKYGLNQWDRVASLLTKKNAKQAKARWNEWVSPNIDKSEWSRDEDEKLLRYARLMPNQWRSIASILGRTATNTVERYHVLLEDAADGELSVSGPGIETLPASGQEGDVNLNPESKAAKPDEEMDDDEREMLSEAKARLANTKGKKAKRKERERMLEESKRIAMLQKRRELKAAGIKVSLTSKNRKKRKEFDFNADIPHERDLPEGPFDISEEADRNTSDRVKFDRDVNKQGVSLKEVDDKIKRDKKKDAREKARSKRKIEPVDDETVTKRSRLELPKPVEDGREYGDDSRSLSSIFKEQPEVEDRDERINRAARDLIHRQALKSTLIDHEVKEEPKELQEEVKEETGRLSKKEVVSLLTAMLQRLPEPRSERIIPFLEPVNEEITEEPVRPRESSAILKGLSVPDPALLATLDLEGVDKQVYNELRALVKSDYKRHVDPTYNAEIIDGIDVDSYDRVMKEIKDIDSKEIPLEEEIDVLPQTFEVAEKIINVLHEFYSRAVQTEDKLAEAIEYDYYNEKRQQLIADIRQEAQEVAELDIEHKTLKLISKEEEAAIEARSKRLNSMVNSVREALSVAEKRLQSRQV